MRGNGRGKLYIISAPSGTGKSTVIKRIMEIRKDLVFSVSATTRPPRIGETNGSSYIFMTRDEFEHIYGSRISLSMPNMSEIITGHPGSPFLMSCAEETTLFLTLMW